MTQNIPLLQRLFSRNDLAEVSAETLLEMVKKYPYFAQARWLLAEKEGPQNQQSLQHAAVYALHPLRLTQHLSENNNKASSPIPEIESGPVPPEHSDTSAAPQIEKADTEIRPAAPLVQPLFTQDYFAYTGAKLPDNMEDDKRPTMEQLHSFTDWLRAMKRPKGTMDPDIQEDETLLAAPWENEDAVLRKNAQKSVQPGEEIVTEAMAEVRADKGQIDKAIAIYEKLSLSNPEKSAYFAQKIKDLKNL